MVTPAVVRLIVVLLALLAGSSIAPVVFAQETAVPAASPAVQQAVLAATPIPGGGRVFALPNGGGFPEGVVYDEATGDFYVGSTVDGTIYRGNVETGTVQVFLPGQPGRVAVGLALDDRGRLFVAGGDTGTVAVYDTATGQQLLEVANGLAPNTFLNDIDMSPTGDAYITDSYNPLLYRLPASAIPAGVGTPAPSPQRMRWRSSSTSPRPASIWHSSGFNANGIVATPDGRYLLIVQTNTGALYRVDTSTGETIQVDLGQGSLPGGDGMELDGQTLWVVRGGQITPRRAQPRLRQWHGWRQLLRSEPHGSDHPGPLRWLSAGGQFQFSQQQGQPQLPFTVSSVPIPGSGGVTGTPTATPVTAGSC